MTQLTFNNIKSQLSSHYYRLLSSTTRLSSDPADWRKSVSQWNEQTQSSIDYRSIKESAGFDAILEIGIGHYRIFEGQTALQILMRLVDRGLGNIGLPLRKTTLHNSKIPFVEAPPVNAQF